jgi:hypothetical protein
MSGNLFYFEDRFECGKLSARVDFRGLVNATRANRLKTGRGQLT